MDHPRLIVNYQPQLFLSDGAEIQDEGMDVELDVTRIILNANAEKLAASFSIHSIETSLDVIDEDIIRHFPDVEGHVANPHGTYRIDYGGDFSPYEFLQECGIASPETVTEADLKSVREKFGIPDAITMPNGRRFIPMESDNPTFISGTILVDLDDLMGRDVRVVMDHISSELTGSSLLSDYSYKLAGSEGDSIRLLVSGDVSEILSCEAEPEETPPSP